MNEQFAEAFINTEHRVLGRKLKPFCLRHCLYLEAIGSPFMGVINGEGVPIKREDLELAVLICSSDSDDVIKSMAKGNTISTLSMRFRRFKPNCTKFASYLADYISLPKTWEKSSKNSKSPKINAPWILSKVMFFITKTSLTLKEAWELPLGELMWYLATFAEQEGGLDFVSEKEQDLINLVKEKQKNGKR